MARTLAHLILLLTGADACTPYIINSVWGEDEAACLALGGSPRQPISHSLENTQPFQSGHKHGPHLDDRPLYEIPCTNLTQRPMTTTDSPITLQVSNNRVYAYKPVPPSTSTTQILTNNRHEYIIPNILPFAEKANHWYQELLLQVIGKI
jgi:hypothetical protein